MTRRERALPRGAALPNIQLHVLREKAAPMIVLPHLFLLPTSKPAMQLHGGQVVLAGTCAVILIGQ